MKTIKRIKKLTEAVAFASKNFDRKVIVADIGTDHGYLAESLSKQNFVEKILATDISEKSLSKLENLIEKESLEKIETRLGNGLEPIKNVDLTVIAGLGGFEMITMLNSQNQGEKVGRKCDIFVLQPTQNVVELRRFLSKKKVAVLSDRVIEDAERFYPIIVVDVSKKSKLKPSVFNIWLGRDNVTSDADFYAFLLNQRELLLFVKNLPKFRILRDKVLREKLKLLHLIEKLLNV